MIGVYSITNPKGHIYIGSSLNIPKRWDSYKKLRTKSQPKIHASLLKYGPAKHKFKVLIECEIDELYEWEHHFANYFQSLGAKGLNCSIPAFNQVKIVKTSTSKEFVKGVSFQLIHSQIMKLAELQKELNKKGIAISKSELLSQALDLLFKKYKI